MISTKEIFLVVYHLNWQGGENSTPAKRGGINSDKPNNYIQTPWWRCYIT